ncbi:hypothetical protein BH09PLA1_BH09PLA1_13810 [soil metagenome]
MFSRIVSKFSPKLAGKRVLPVAVARRTALMENLEDRRLMSITVSSIIADNRGKVLITLNPNGETVDATTLTKTSCIMYSAGADKILGTADDVRERESVTWTPAFNRITINSKQKAGTGYRIRLSATRIKTLGGQVMDGEFNSSGESGNGSPGGDYNIQTKNDKGSAPQVRMNTTLGTVVLRVNRTAAPLTSAYFLGRTDNGFYDDVMINKSVSGTNGQVGAGSIKITPANEYEVTSIGDGKTPENTGLAHSRGTIAMERIPIDTTKEGNGFFFNTSNNTSNRSVFGSVRSGIAVLDSINALTAINLAPQHQFVLVDTSKVPIRTTATNATFSPQQDAVMINRTAVQMRIAAV